MNQASLIATIRAGARELPFESTIRGAVVIRRLICDLPESELVPGLSEPQAAIEAVRRTITHAHDVHLLRDPWEDGHVFVFSRRVTEGRRRRDLEVEVMVDPSYRAVIVDARVTRPEAHLYEDGWRTPAPSPMLPVGLIACPCCGHATLSMRGFFEICPVCFWEDDGQDNDDADMWRGGPNAVSLREARVNFLRFGASVEVDCESVRRPTVEEVQLRRFDEEGHELTEE